MTGEKLSNGTLLGRTGCSPARTSWGITLKYEVYRAVEAESTAREGSIWQELQGILGDESSEEVTMISTSH